VKNPTETNDQGENGSLASEVSKSLLELAIAHFKAVLADEKSTASAKSQAAQELARIGKTEDGREQSAMHRLPRPVLLAEIARIRRALSGR
jgi:hypothetical protein